MTTLIDLRDEIKLTIGRENLDSLIDRKINQAYVQLIFMLRIPDFLAVRVIPTVAATPNYALNADEFAPLSIRDKTNKRHPRPIEWLQYDELEDTLQGIPTTWCAYGNEILFHPTPKDIYQMRVRMLKRPAQLTVAAPTIVTIPEYDEALTLLSLYKVCVTINESDTAALAQKGFEDSLRLLRIRETVIKEHAFNQGLAWGSEQ
jgi:hypothetical protein